MAQGERPWEEQPSRVLARKLAVCAGNVHTRGCFSTDPIGDGVGWGGRGGPGVNRYRGPSKAHCPRLSPWGPITPPVTHHLLVLWSLPVRGWPQRKKRHVPVSDEGSWVYSGEQRWGAGAGCGCCLLLRKVGGSPRPHQWRAPFSPQAIHSSSEMLCHRPSLHPSCVTLIKLCHPSPILTGLPTVLPLLPVTKLASIFSAQKSPVAPNTFTEPPNSFIFSLCVSPGKQLGFHFIYSPGECVPLNSLFASQRAVLWRSTARGSYILFNKRQSLIISGVSPTFPLMVDSSQLHPDSLDPLSLWLGLCCALGVSCHLCPSKSQPRGNPPSN